MDLKNTRQKTKDLAILNPLQTGGELRYIDGVPIFFIDFSFCILLLVCCLKEQQQIESMCLRCEEML